MTFDELQDKIKIKLKNQTLLKQAFVHRSYLNEDRSIKASNERLEFLGDAVLSFLTSHYLYETYPDFPEGKLTNIRSSLVNTKSLASIAKDLGFGNLLFLSRGEKDSGGRTNQSLLADAFEAMLGAIFLDQGLATADSFLKTWLFSKTQAIIDQRAYVDFKSLLQEIIQEKTRISPTYHVVKSEGPDHAKTFWVEVHAGTEKLGEGMGHNKQEAEAQAAHDALEKLGKE